MGQERRTIERYRRALFTLWLAELRTLNALMFPHAVGCNNIAKQRPPDHPCYCRPIRQLHQCLCPEWDKHSSEPHKCTGQGSTPAKAGRDIGSVSSQILSEITHFFILADRGAASIRTLNCRWKCPQPQADACAKLRVSSSRSNSTLRPCGLITLARRQRVTPRHSLPPSYRAGTGCV